MRFVVFLARTDSDGWGRATGSWAIRSSATDSSWKSSGARPDACATRPLITAADVAVRMARLKSEVVEVFVAIGVNARNRVVGKWVIAPGWESGVNLTPRQVMTLLVKECVGRVIFVHNHPSGDPTPSPEDVRFTQRLSDAAKTLDSRVLDHVVVSATGHASLREPAAGAVM